MTRINLVGISCLLYGTIFWGLVWYPYRLLSGGGIEPISASLVSFFVALIFSLFSIIPKHFKELLANKKSLFIYASIGCLTNICYVLAVVYGEVVRSMLLFFMSPLWTIFLSYFLIDDEQLTAKHCLVALLSVLGGMIILADFKLSLNIQLSDVFAIVAGMGFAATNVLAKKFKKINFQLKSLSIWSGVFFGGLVIEIFYGHFQFLENIFNPHNAMIILIIGALLFVSTLIVQYGLPRVNPVQTSPIFLFEIIVASLSSFYLADELLSLKDFIGGFLILTSITVSVFD